MKVAYLFEPTNSREILENMIIPQMEKDIHGADVVGKMFFFDNCYTDSQLKTLIRKN